MVKLYLKFERDREELKVNMGYERVLRETMQIRHDIVVPGLL